MRRRDEGWGPTIAISISDSPDLARLGMSERHLSLAMETMATYLLSSGYRLAYGGDLREDGFTEQLFELIRRYDRSAQSNGQPGMTQYLPWPVCTDLTRARYHDLSSRLRSIAEIRRLAHDGTVLEDSQFPETSLADKREVATSLTAMRRTMLKETAARIVLGGRVTRYQGSMPGIAEEALLTVQARRPLYLIGGFGGCARDIAEILELVEHLHEPPRSTWDGHAEFSSYRADALNNGLTDDENRDLAKTPHIFQAVRLILRGLDRTEIALNDHF